MLRPASPTVPRWVIGALAGACLGLGYWSCVGKDTGSTEQQDTAFDAGAHQQARQQMVRDQLQGRDIRDQGVLAAMGRVPRHRFVPASLRRRAYHDRPLPI